MTTNKKMDEAYRKLAAAVIKKAIRDSTRKTNDCYTKSAVYFLKNIKLSLFWSILNNGQYEAERIELLTGIQINN